MAFRPRRHNNTRYQPLQEKISELASFLGMPRQEYEHYLYVSEWHPDVAEHYFASLRAKCWRLGIDPDNLPVFPMVNTGPSSGVVVGHQIVNGVAIASYCISPHKGQHTLIVGSTSSGKSNLNKVWLATLLKEPEPVWIFDFLREYRSLLHYSPDTLILDIKNFRVNLLLPLVQFSCKQWLQHFVENYSHSFRVLTGSKSFILATMTDFVDSYISGHEFYPTLPEYVDYLERLRLTKEYRNYWPVNLVRFRTICQALGPMINVHKGYLDELLATKKNVIFELDSIAEAELQNFVVELLLTAFFLRNEKCL